MKLKKKRGRRTAASNLTTQPDVQQQHAGCPVQAQPQKPRLIDLARWATDDDQQIQRILASEIRALIVALAAKYRDKAGLGDENATEHDIADYVRPGMLPRELIRVAAALAELCPYVADAKDAAALTAYLAWCTECAFEIAPLDGPRFYEVIRLMVNCDKGRLRAAQADGALGV